MSPLLRGAAPPAPQGDALGRVNPRSTVTRFLETCRTGDYEAASQYLDLGRIPEYDLARQGAALAKDLEAILNAAGQLDVNSLSQNAGADSPYTIANLRRYGQTYALTVTRTQSANGGPAIWRFSPQTVADVPGLNPSEQNPLIARYLPKVFLTAQALETPLWKWLALALAIVILLALSRWLDLLFLALARILARRKSAAADENSWMPWVHRVVTPIRVLVCLAVFRLCVVIVDPSAVLRLYLGRILQLIFAWTVAWCLVQLIDLFFLRIETGMRNRQQAVSRSLLRMGRRTANMLVILVTLLVLLSNWGYNTTTLIAGLGVGGIAVALAAQQTIANVFGGVSVIGDHPVGVGDFGKFGDLIGTVEDIGMRSTRVRTLNRTIISIPNASFAGFNLENYSVRDKILFNPTFKIKRQTPDEKVRALTGGLAKAIGKDKRIEMGQAPVRVTGLASDSFSLEIFCYVLTDDVNEFYAIQEDLLLTINRVLNETGVELAA